jgi:hypothetical protein
MWGAAVVIAVGAASTAVAMAGADRRDSGVLSQDDVARQLRASDDSNPTGPGQASEAPTAPVSEAPTTPGGAPTAGSEQQRLSLPAAVITARCDAGMASLVTWAPNPGYRVDEVVRGPGKEASIYLESDRFDDVRYILSCTPQLHYVTQQEFDDHGGGKSGRG